MKIVGFSFSKGNYEGWEYDNIIMHCVDTGDIGSVVTTVKIKSADFYDVFVDFVTKYGDKIPPVRDIMHDLIGCTCRVLYDKRGKYAADVRIIDKPESPDLPF